MYKLLQERVAGLELKILHYGHIVHLVLLSKLIGINVLVFNTLLKLSFWKDVNIDRLVNSDLKYAYFYRTVKHQAVA